MIESIPPPAIFPPEVRAHAVTLRVDDYHDELPASLGLPLPRSLDRAVPGRRAQYLAGRYCARAALTELLGEAPGPVDRSPGGPPVWPAGTVGSITHNQGLALAAVAHRATMRALGVDSEPLIAAETLARIGRLVAAPVEGRLAGRLDLDRRTFFTLVFCAKESLYKALHPISGRFFDFLEAEVVEVAPSRLRLRLAVDLGPELPVGCEVEGRYAVSRGQVHAAVTVPARPARGRPS